MEEQVFQLTTLNERAQNLLLSSLRKGADSPTDQELLSIDKELREVIAQEADTLNLLFYNEFRIANAFRLPKTRPQILIGGSTEMHYPGLHSVPLFEVADVVCLTCKPMPYSFASCIYCDPSTLFSDIIKSLPPGFTPDFYWDNQVEHDHFIPAGIASAPFPIIASVCHTFLHKTVEHVCALFDRVLPISPFHGNLLRNKFPEKIIDFPFGLNWASFDWFIAPCWEKTIDVSVTFTENDYPFLCGKRNQVIALTRLFKKKYGDRFSIEISPNLPRADYLNLLKKSRIAINVTGLHGSYN